MNCKHYKYKKIFTHGRKSRGYYICKNCNNVIKKPKRGKR